MAASTPILYANSRLFCILTSIWWQGSEWRAAEGECRASAMYEGGVGVCRLVSLEIVEIMKKLCWDFKANGRSFPVVMADTGMFRQQARTHLVTHSCQQ